MRHPLGDTRCFRPWSNVCARAWSIVCTLVDRVWIDKIGLKAPHAGRWPADAKAATGRVRCLGAVPTAVMLIGAESRMSMPADDAFEAPLKTRSTASTTPRLEPERWPEALSRTADACRRGLAR